MLWVFLCVCNFKVSFVIAILPCVCVCGCFIFSLSSLLSMCVCFFCVQRHLIAVFLGLSMCGTILVVYTGRGVFGLGYGAEGRSGAGRPESAPTPAPPPPPPLTGYINFIDHKVPLSHPLSGRAKG